MSRQQRHLPRRLHVRARVQAKVTRARPVVAWASALHPPGSAGRAIASYARRQSADTFTTYKLRSRSRKGSERPEQLTNFDDDEWVHRRRYDPRVGFWMRTSKRCSVARRCKSASFGVGTYIGRTG